MTRIHFMKHLACAIIFSGLCTSSTFSYEYNQDQLSHNSNTTHSTYHQSYDIKSRSSQIKVTGIFAVILGLFDWLRASKQEKQVGPVVVQPVNEQAPTSTKEVCSPKVYRLPMLPILVKPEEEQKLDQERVQACFKEIDARNGKHFAKGFISYVARIAENENKLRIIAQWYNHRFQERDKNKGTALGACVDENREDKEKYEQGLERYFEYVSIEPSSRAYQFEQRRALRKMHWECERHQKLFFSECRELRPQLAQIYLRLYNENMVVLSHCHGTTRQQIFHHELIDIIDAAAKQYEQHGENPYNILATQCAQFGMWLNSMEDFTAAFFMADMGWLLIDMSRVLMHGELADSLPDIIAACRSYRFEYTPDLAHEKFYHAIVGGVSALLSEFGDCADLYVHDQKQYDKKMGAHKKRLNAIQVAPITSKDIRACSQSVLQRLVKKRVKEFVHYVSQDQMLKATYVRTIIRRSCGTGGSNTSQPSFDLPSGSVGNPEDSDGDDNDDDDLVKTIKKLIAKQVRKIGDETEIPEACKQDPLYKMLSEEQKQELMSTREAKQKFIALLIQRHEKILEFMQELGVTSDNAEKTKLDDQPEFQDLMYECINLSQEEFTEKIVQLTRELTSMPDSSRKQAIKNLLLLLDVRNPKKPLSSILQQYAQEAESIDDNTHLAQSREQRKHACESQTDDSISTQTYAPSPFVQKLLALLGLDKSSFTECTGNSVQQAIHKDVLQLLEDAGKADDGLSWDNPLNILMAKFAQMAMFDNFLQNYDGAMMMADVTAGLLDIRDGIGRAAWHEATDVFGWLFSIGFAGISLYATPKVSAAVTALCLICFVGRIVWELGKLGYESWFDKPTYDVKIAALIKPKLGSVAEVVAGFGFSIIRDIFVQHALRAFITGICKPMFMRQMSPVIEQQKPPQVPKEKSDNSRFKPPKAPKKKPKVPKASTRKVTGKRRQAAKRMARRKKRVKAAQQVRAATRIPWHDLNTELQSLRGKFDNIEIFNTYPIRFDYKHIFEWVWKEGKWKGFHHDWMGELERRGFYTSKVKRTTADGFYEADITINGMVDKKTFFPQDMTRAEVCEMVMNAYTESKHAAEFQTRSGVWTIKHKISNKIELFIVVRKTGYIKSVYPRFIEEL